MAAEDAIKAERTKPCDPPADGAIDNLKIGDKIAGLNCISHGGLMWQWWQASARGSRHGCRISCSERSWGGAGSTGISASHFWQSDVDKLGDCGSTGV